MTLILTCVVLIAFLTGLCIGYAKGHESRECLRRACRKLVESNRTLRALNAEHQLYWHEYGDVERVEPDESDEIMTEWLAMYDPRYHSTETE